MSDDNQMRRIGEQSAYLECFKVIDKHLGWGIPSHDWNEGQRIAYAIRCEIVEKWKLVKPEDTE